MTDKILVENPVTISLADYVNGLDDSRKTERRKFREALSELIVCSPVTMIQKIRENRWTIREKEIIAKYLNAPIEILFPEARS